MAFKSKGGVVMGNMIKSFQELTPQLQDMQEEKAACWLKCVTHKPVPGPVISYPPP